MDPYALESVDAKEPSGLHALMRFLRVVRRHKGILFGFILAAAVLAVIKHKRTAEEYQSSARLMVRQLQSAATKYDPKATTSLLNSYRQLLLSDNVLLNAMDSLEVKPPEIVDKNPPRSLWPEILRSILTVTFQEKGNVLDVSCRSRSPEATVDVIHALSKSSAEFMERFQRNDAMETVRNLDLRREDIEKQLFDKERILLDARKSCGDITVNKNSDEAHPLIQRVRQINENLTQVRGQRIELQSLFASAQEQVAANEDLSLIVQSLSAIVGDSLLDQIPGLRQVGPELLQEMRSKLKTQYAELTALRRHFGSRHSEVVRRETEIANQQTLIAETEQQSRRSINGGLRDPEIGRWLLTTLRSELRSRYQYELTLQAEYTSVENEALRLRDKIATIEVTARQVETLQATHRSLLERLTSINIQPEGGVFKVASLTEPLLPAYPAYPVLSNTLVVFVLAGAAAALLIIYILDLLDDRLGSPEEVQDELGLSVLGVIRKLPDDQIEKSKIYVHGYAQTVHAECFRTLKTAITLSPMDTKCLAVTSTEASEGKTTTTVNLAASYAQTGQRTLLIDADMRRPGLSRLLDVRGNGGLSEVLRAETGIPDLCVERVVQTDVEGLHVLPCGPRILNAGVLLSMPALADVLDWAVSNYDQVIVDCPPTLPVSDAAIVGRFVDGMLFLMNPDKTHRRSVARAVDQLRAMGLKIVGIVANTSLSEDRNSYGYQYGYGYGYGAEYAYGHEEEDETPQILSGKAA